MELEINEYIEFMDFNSKKEGLLLLNRYAPTPEEKSVIKNIPYQQGVLDFSFILGERVYENREITYEFLLIGKSYNDRKIFERNLKHKLMRHGNQRLYESYNFGFFWLVKCKSVEIEQDYKFGNLKATIVFDSYPYIFSNNNYFADFWDDFYFDSNVANYTKFAINGTKEIVVGNGGTISVKPEIIANTNFKIDFNGEIFNIKKGTTNDYYFSLKPGANTMKVTGNGVLQFRYRYEVMA